MQRFFDVVLSGTAILFLCPLLIPLMVVLRFTGEGEIFYSQVRVGLGQRQFKLFKFATMLKNSPNIGCGTLTMANDPRVLPLGAVLRKTKVNELPQLFNIFLGDMSIVGPRPLVPEGEEYYGKNHSKIIRSVRPGVTGVGSLVLRDEEAFYAHRADARVFYRDVISPYKFLLENWYVENRSFILDIKIIILTATAVLSTSFTPEKYLDNIPKMPEEMLESRLKK